MEMTNAVPKGANGFTLVEVLLAMIIIATSAVAVLMWQKTSWSQSSATNKLILAGQVVEKQLEAQRMNIANNPNANFTAYKTGFDNRDSLVADQTVTPPIYVRWHAFDTLHDPNGHLITDVLKLNAAAYWVGAKPSDTLFVETRIAKNF